MEFFINYLEGPIINSKLLSIYRRLEEQVYKNLRNGGIQTRPVKKNGLWCCILIPAILLSYTLFYNVSPVYATVAYISLGLLTYSILYAVFLYMSTLIFMKINTSGYMASTFSAAALICSLTNYSVFFALGVSVITIAWYNVVLNTVLLKCPKTFTVGEAMILSQAVSLSTAAIFLTVHMHKYTQEHVLDEETMLILTYVVASLSTVGLLVAAMLNLGQHWKTLKSLVALLIIAVLIVFVEVSLVLGSHGLHKFYSYLFRDSKRVKLIMVWMVLVLCSAAAVVGQAGVKEKATSSTRKVFHVLGSLVFLSGILYDKEFLALAAGIVFAAIIFIEALRLWNVEEISPALQEAYHVYADEKDLGVFAVSPIYLYLGLASPLVLVPWLPDTQLDLLSGVLSIGVGDTAASWYGARYGKNKWPQSLRTVEGTIANAALQIILVVLLQIFGLISDGSPCLRAVVAGCVSALVESQLEQVDNLVLPLITILAFQSTAWLAEPNCIMA